MHILSMSAHPVVSRAERRLECWTPGSLSRLLATRNSQNRSMIAVVLGQHERGARR